MVDGAGREDGFEERDASEVEERGSLDIESALVERRDEGRLSGGQGSREEDSMEEETVAGGG